MKRKTTLATAAAVTLVLLAGSAAAATNLGLFDSASETGTVGRLTPQEATADPSRPDTIIVEPATQPRISVDERTPTVNPRQQDDDAYESDDDHAADDSQRDHDDEDGDGDERYEGHDDDD